MTVYAHLLSQALAEDQGPDLPVGDLISSAIAWRESMERSSDAGGRLAAAIAYDITLVRLCDYYGVAQDLTGPRAGPAARAEVEAALGVFVPALRVGVA